jgi:hypothetical protein
MQAYGKHPTPPSLQDTHHSGSSSNSSSSSMLAAASLLLHKVPGARRISLFNATLLALLGIGAALAASGGGCAALLVLLARYGVGANMHQQLACSAAAACSGTKAYHLLTALQILFAGYKFLGCWQWGSNRSNINMWGMLWRVNLIIVCICASPQVVPSSPTNPCQLAPSF